MKVPGRVILATASLAAVAGGLGLIAGLRGLPTETALINAAADDYTRSTSRPRTDCVGIPGIAEVWIEVRCGDGSALRSYLFDRRGNRLVAGEEPTT